VLAQISWGVNLSNCLYDKILIGIIPNRFRQLIRWGCSSSVTSAWHHLLSSRCGPASRLEVWNSQWQRFEAGTCFVHAVLGSHSLPSTWALRLSWFSVYYYWNQAYKVCLWESWGRGLQGYWAIRISVIPQRGIDDILHWRIGDYLVPSTTYDTWTTQSIFINRSLYSIDRWLIKWLRWKLRATLQLCITGEHVLLQLHSATNSTFL